MILDDYDPSHPFLSNLLIDRVVMVFQCLQGLA